jgi:hypothetical protein
MIKYFKIRSLKRKINRLENQIMTFEIPYDIAIDRVNKLEEQLAELV